MSSVLDKGEVRRALGAAIAQHREQAGISQAELGRRLGLTSNYVSQWEAGNGVSEHFVYSVDDALGLPRGTIHQTAATHMACCVLPPGAQRRSTPREALSALPCAAG